jgi:flagellar M-ring protein FliF
MATDNTSKTVAGRTLLGQIPPAARQLLLLVGLAGAVAMGVASVLWLQEPSYTPVYSGLAERDTGEVVNVLDGAQIPYRVDPSSGSVMVPATRKYEVRMQLASAGLPRGSGFGIEEMPTVGGFGQSPFVENALYVHAVETELSRTIGSLAQVEAARVHLAIPPQSAFMRRQAEASASVMLKLYPGRRLDPSQAGAVVHLVASSVPGLEPGRVTLVDQSGTLLSSPDEGTTAGLTTTQFEYAKRVEEAYAERIENLLAPLVGPERIRATVSAELDFTQTEQTRESFDPQITAVRSEQTSEESRSGDALAQGVPGALSNQPPEAAPAGPGGQPQAATETATPLSTSRSAVRNYELDKTVSHTKQAVGAVKRLSVAVLIDNKPPASGRGPAQPLAQEELDSLTDLVKQAVGFTEARGDTISVLNSAFQPTPQIAEPDPVGFLQRPQVWDMARQALAALLVLVLAFVIVRPIMRQLTTPQPALFGPADGQAQGMLAANLMALPASHADRVAAARSAVNQDPRQVAQVVRTWVAEDNG